jgi:hypothetical protein
VHNEPPEDWAERPTITFWWPTSQHPVWADPTRTDRGDSVPYSYGFATPFHKGLVQRCYKLSRQLGAPPLAARWHANTECQRQIHLTLIARFMHGDKIEADYGTPMAWLTPDPDDWDDEVPDDDCAGWD